MCRAVFELGVSWPETGPSEVRSIPCPRELGQGQFMSLFATISGVDHADYYVMIKQGLCTLFWKKQTDQMCYCRTIILLSVACLWFRQHIIIACFYEYGSQRECITLLLVSIDAVLIT